MYTLPATQYEPAEIVLSRSEEDWLERRQRELAAEAIDNAMPAPMEWVLSVMTGEHRVLDVRLALDVIGAALAHVSAPTMERRRDELERAVDDLRNRYVDERHSDYASQAWQEFNERAED